MRVTLTATEGPDAGRKFVFEGYGTFVFGRAGTPDGDLQRPSDPAIAREHLLVDASARGVAARAVAGKTPFWLDGTQRAHATVPDGAELRVGRSAFRVTVERQDRGAPGPERPREPGLPRRRLDEYELGPELGRGAMGVVRRAVDRASGEVLAVKVIVPDAEFPDLSVAYALREIEIAGRLDHPAIVRTLAVGREGEALFLAMELVEGTNLERRVRDHGLLAPRDAARVGVAVLGGLAHAHDRGLVHRDVKPENVMVVEGPDGLTGRLLDFGLARSFRASGLPTLTATGEIKGALLYGSPECLRDAKRARPPADLFSLGATLYRALTGHYYFDEERYASDLLPVLLRAEFVPVRERRPEVPAALAAVVEKALAADPAARWTDASEMAAALEASVEGVGPDPTRAARTGASGAAARPSAAERTQWAFVRALAASPASPEWEAAWGDLHRGYRPALLAYARALLRRWRVPEGTLGEEAEEMVQGFLAACVEKGWLARADPERGGFRAFVRTMLMRWVRDRMEARYARKRAPEGGVPVSLGALPEPPADPHAPDPAEEALRAEWTRCLLRAAVERVRLRSEPGARYLGLLVGGAAPDEEVACAVLGVDRARLASRRHQARKMLAQALWDELKATVADPAERESERAALAPYLEDFVDPLRNPSFHAPGRIPHPGNPN